MSNQYVNRISSVRGLREVMGTQPKPPLDPKAERRSIELRVREVEMDELVEIVRTGNVCGCEALRCMSRSGDSFIVLPKRKDNPNLVPECAVVREADGAVIEHLSFWDESPEHMEELLRDAMRSEVVINYVTIEPHRVGSCSYCR